jgi:hypothetical protein
MMMLVVISVTLARLSTNGILAVRMQSLPGFFGGEALRRDAKTLQNVIWRKTGRDG